MFAVDDGIANGNNTAADVFFLIAVVLGVLYGLLAYKNPPTDGRVSALLLGFSIACVAFGLLML